MRYAKAWYGLIGFNGGLIRLYMDQCSPIALDRTRKGWKQSPRLNEAWYAQIRLSWTRKCWKSSMRLKWVILELERPDESLGNKSRARAWSQKPYVTRSPKNQYFRPVQALAVMYSAAAARIRERKSIFDLDCQTKKIVSDRKELNVQS